MNTRLSLLLPGIDEAVGTRLTAAVAAVVAANERVMSRFAADAELARINQAAGRGASPISEKLCAVLAECRDHWRRTQGAFDVTLGAVNDNWRGGTGAVRTGWHHVELNEVERWIALHDPAVRLDLGGVGKGIALREVRDLLRARGVRHALLSFGESSIVAIGPHPAGGAWQLGVCDRFDAAETVYDVDLVDASLSTSGVSVDRPHLLAPHTGGAAGGDRQISVVVTCPVDAEVLSTALIAAPPSDRPAIVARYGAVTAVEFEWHRDGARWRRDRGWTHAA